MLSAQEAGACRGLKSIGLAEGEARVGLGVLGEVGLRQRVASGATAAEFWEAIKNMKE